MSIGHVPENYNKVKCSSNCNNSKVEWDESGEYELMIPLRFSFNRFKENILPLIALYSPRNYHELKFIIEFQTKTQLIQCKSNCPTVSSTDNEKGETLSKCSYIDSECNIQDGHLIIEGMHLGDEERKKYKDSSLEYLVEQLQFTGVEQLYSYRNKIRLNFNHPVKELIFFFSKYKYLEHNDVRSKSIIEDSKDAINILEMCDYIESLQLTINGQDWFQQELPSKYFTTVQQSQHHTNQDDNIYCYSFSEHPEQFQPSGSLNFSSIDNATLLLTLKQNSLNPEKDELS